MIVYENIGATQDSLRCCIKGNCADCLFKPRNTDCIHRLLSFAVPVAFIDNLVEEMKNESNYFESEENNNA